METVNEVPSIFGARSEGRLVHRDDESKSMKQPSLLGWYRILRMHYQWHLFEAIRYALWLSR